MCLVLTDNLLLDGRVVYEWRAFSVIAFEKPPRYSTIGRVTTGECCFVMDFSWA